MSVIHAIPNEIWLEIFSWLASLDHYTWKYNPFQVLSGAHAVGQMKSVLPLVCRKWKDLAADLLYREVVISRSQETLKSALETRNRGSLVRRVVLPYHATNTPRPGALVSVQILRLCHQLEILIRPHIIEPVRFEFDADNLPELPSLKLIQWWQYGIDAERSGGINSLISVLQNSANVEYLSISGSSSMGPYYDPRPISLPHLHTLRLKGVNATLLCQITNYWSLPAFTNLILDYHSHEHLHGLWAFGAQLRVIELGKHLKFLAKDFLASCLENCPNLRELNYFLFFTLPTLFKSTHSSLSTIGLHFAENAMLAGDIGPSSHAWLLLESHLEKLLGLSFPELRRLRFFESRKVVNCEQFIPWEQKLRTRGYFIEFL